MLLTRPWVRFPLPFDAIAASRILVQYATQWQSEVEALWNIRSCSLSAKMSQTWSRDPNSCNEAAAVVNCRGAAYREMNSCTYFGFAEGSYA